MINQQRIKLNKNSNSVEFIIKQIQDWMVSKSLYRSQSQNILDQDQFQQKRQSQTETKGTQNYQKKIVNQSFNNSLNVEVMQKTMEMIKFPIHILIQKVPSVFVKDIITYVIMQKLSWTILDQSNDKDCSKSKQNIRQLCSNQCRQKIKKVNYDLSKQLKGLYQQICQKDIQFWKSQFNFQLLCVILTQISVQYIEENIKQVMVQKKLISQIYIIIVHVFLGIQVSPQTYSIISKKFIKKPNHKAKSIKKILQIKQTQSFQILHSKKLLNQQNLNFQPNIDKNMTSLITSSNQKGFINKQIKLLSKKSYQKSHNNFTFLKQIKRKTFFNQIYQNSKQSGQLQKQFLRDLKQNLYVDPLPPVVKKKLNINQIDKIYETFNKKQFKDFDLQDKKRHIKSNQVSLSMDTYLRNSVLKQQHRNSQTDLIKQEINKTINFKQHYLPIKGINLKLKSQKSSAHYYASQNNSYQQQKQSKNKQLESERIYSLINKQKQPRQNTTIQKKKKNLKEWSSIIQQLKNNHPKQDFNFLASHLYQRKKQKTLELNLEGNAKEDEVNYIKNLITKGNKTQKSSIQQNQVNKNIHTRMSEARTEDDIQSILRYASILKSNQISNHLNCNKNELELPNKDYSSLQPRINESQYRQNAQNHKMSSFGLKKKMILFSENCKRRNEYIVSSIFKKNNFPSYN